MGSAVGRYKASIVSCSNSNDKYVVGRWRMVGRVLLEGLVNIVVGQNMGYIRDVNL